MPAIPEFITLHAPRLTKQDALGQLVPDPGQPVPEPITVRALRADRGSFRGGVIFGDAVGINSNTVFEFRRSHAARAISETWEIRDTDGNLYGIDHIAFLDWRKWRVFCTRRQSRTVRPDTFRGFQAPAGGVRGFARRGEGERGFLQ